MDNPLDSKNITEMLTVANEYCHFVERAYNYKPKDILLYMQKILPLLYIKGSLLPDIHVQSQEANEKFVTEENWEILFNEFRNKFKSYDEFWFIDHSDFNFKEAEKASLADNLTDLYQDLKDFVLLYAKGTQAAKENAVRDCKYYFETHWGFRIVRALKYIHTLLNSHKNMTNDNQVF
jgi:hypothetical protein